MLIWALALSNETVDTAFVVVVSRDLVAVHSSWKRLGRCGGRSESGEGTILLAQKAAYAIGIRVVVPAGDSARMVNGARRARDGRTHHVKKDLIPIGLR